MCRIAGILDYSQPNRLRGLAAMRDSMQHGGPDDHGEYYDPAVPLAMGVRRLALIDLTAAGHQPMLGMHAVLAFNGEIYNFDDIRQKLKQMGCRFRGNSDTEVVLQAYEQWGADCFQYFNGMFALAIWDRNKQQLILARDHAGMKPLYYYLNKHTQQCYFASEIRALRALRPEWPEDPYWRVRLLSFGFVPEPHTILEQVQCLPAGHVLTITVPQWTSTLQEWYQAPAALIYTDDMMAKQALHEAITNAVFRQQIADAPLGVLLSGGIDSSVIALAALEKRKEPINTVSLYFEDAVLSENSFQREMAKLLASKHHAFLITQKEFENELPEFLKAIDQPSNDGINSYFICKYARQIGLKAVLSGLGADELMGGYPSFKRQRWVKPLQTLGPMLGASSLFVHDTLKRLAYLQYPSDNAHYLFHRGYFNLHQIAALSGYTKRQVVEVLQLNQPVQNGAPDSSLQLVSRMEQQQYMRNQLLRDTDVMSMWHGLEVRLPFLDREVLDVVQQTSDSIRFARKPAKKWLIESFAKQLPENIWRRSKMGFVFPFSKWMQACHLAGACHPMYFEIRKRFLAGEYQWSRYWAYLLSTGEPIVTKQPQKRIAFASLRTFSSMGGIEKFNRAYAKALSEIARKEGWQVSHFSAYDEQGDAKYFPKAAFVGFGKQRILFLWFFFKYYRYYSHHILAHVNLAPLPIIMRRKKFHTILLVHGIEVWQPLKGMRYRALLRVSEVWSVSQFTAQQLQQAHPKFCAPIRIFPNTIDPFFQSTPALGSWKIPSGYMLTISRLQSTEQYKGYDSVIRQMPFLLKKYPDLRYIIGGSAEPAELQRIKLLISQNALEKHVLLAGFIPDEELPYYYAHASVFVMPSRKEGFGIVFLEAAACGARIIAGNADGSPEALLQGELGTLISPSDDKALMQALDEALDKGPLDEAERNALQQKVNKHFGFAVFCHRLHHYLDPEHTAPTQQPQAPPA